MPQNIAQDITQDITQKTKGSQAEGAQVEGSQAEGSNGDHKKPRNAVARVNRHRQIMVMLLKGIAVKEIARELGYAPASISILIRTAGFQLELGKLRDIVLVHVEDELSKMGRLTPLAHGFYEKVLRDNNNVYSSDMKFKVSKDLFDRLGVKVAEGERLNPGEVGDVADMVQTAFDKAKVIEAEGVEIVGGDGSVNRANGANGAGSTDGVGSTAEATANAEGFEREGEKVTGEQITKELQELLADSEPGEGETEHDALQEIGRV